MFDWLFGRTGKKDTSGLDELNETIKKEEEQREQEDQKKREELRKKREEERKKKLVQLECTGNYSFDVEEVPESEKKNKSRCRMSVNGVISSWYPTHNLKIVYNIAVIYNGDEYHLYNEFLFREFDDEGSLYEYIADLLKDDEKMEFLQIKLKKEIVKQLEEHLKDNNMAEIKKTIEENNNFDINFTIETEKTKNM